MEKFVIQNSVFHIRYFLDDHLMNNEYRLTNKECCIIINMQIIYIFYYEKYLNRIAAIMLPEAQDFEALGC